MLAVAGAPDNRQRFYFGAVNGGVWRTDDAGRTWTPIFDAVPVGSIGALAVAPSAPSVIYAGTGEADMRSDIAQGIGMFRSEDGGAHWAPAGLADSQQIGKILVDPRDPRTAAGGGTRPSVWAQSDAGGLSLRRWGPELGRGRCFAMRIRGRSISHSSPGQPDVVYAALWQTRRPPWNVYPPSSGPGSGLYKSVDGGRSWVQLRGHGLAWTGRGGSGMAVSEARPGRVYALVNRGRCGRAVPL